MSDRPQIQPTPPPGRFAGLALPVRIGLVLVAVLVALGALRSSLVEWNDVPSRSMRPTILEGDRIVVSRAAYDVRLPFFGSRLWRRGDPAHGDLVVYVGPRGARAVKRVIGAPGDRIEIRDHRVIRNGEALTQASGRATSGIFGYRLYGEDSSVGYFVMIANEVAGTADMAPVVVPDGHYFLMGDNRGHSRDSREIGTIPRDRIIGRAALVAFSRDATGFREGRFLTRLR